MREEYVTCSSTASNSKPCPHHTGWFSSIDTFWGRNNFFWCDLCHNPIKIKDLPLTPRSK